MSSKKKISLWDEPTADEVEVAAQWLLKHFEKNRVTSAYDTHIAFTEAPFAVKFPLPKFRKISKTELWKRAYAIAQNNGVYRDDSGEYPKYIYGLEQNRQDVIQIPVRIDSNGVKGILTGVKEAVIEVLPLTGEVTITLRGKLENMEIKPIVIKLSLTLVLIVLLLSYLS